MTKPHLRVIYFILYSYCTIVYCRWCFYLDYLRKKGKRRALKILIRFAIVKYLLIRLFRFYALYRKIKAERGPRLLCYWRKLKMRLKLWLNRENSLKEKLLEHDADCLICHSHHDVADKIITDCCHVYGGSCLSPWIEVICSDLYIVVIGLLIPCFLS